MRNSLAFIAIILSAIFPLLAPSSALAKGAKTVHVSGYTRKDGTYVRPHMRSPPGSGSASYSPPRTSYSTSGRTSYRSSPHTQARSSYSLGSLGSVYESGARMEENDGPPSRNVPPTDIFLSPDSLASRPPDKTVVGRLSAVDPNPNDRHTFKLLSEEDHFAIDDRSLIVMHGDSIDRRKKKVHQVRISAIDQSGASFSKAVTISVVRPGPLSARYLAYFKSGRTKELAEYIEQETDFILVGTERSFTRYPKGMIKSIEATGAEDAAIPEHRIRNWTDSQGSHHTRAAYAGMKSGKVQLRKDNGKTVLVGFERLSEIDQQYVLKTLHDDDGG